MIYQQKSPLLTPVYKSVPLEMCFIILSFAPEEDVDAVDVAAVQSDRVGALSGRVLETEEVVGHLRRAGHLAGTVQAQHQQVHHQAVVLHNEGGELEPPDDAVRVGMVHVLHRQRKTFRANTK